MASLMRLPRALSARLQTLPKPACRTFTTTLKIHSSWSPGPAPPRLPKEDQEMFEQLQKQSAIGGAFSTPPPSNINPAQPEAQASQSPSLRPQINQSPHSQPTQGVDESVAEFKARVDASGEGEELHPNIRRGAKPEFTGETNPKTGEVGGPKNEPLRWGGASDWSYNGRVTDF